MSIEKLKNFTAAKKIMERNIQKISTDYENIQLFCFLESLESAEKISVKNQANNND